MGEKMEEIDDFRLLILDFGFLKGEERLWGWKHTLRRAD